MDHEVAFIRIGFCKNNLVPLAGFAEVDDVSQILLRWRRDIAVRRSKRVQLQIFFVLRLSNLRFGFAALLDPFLDILHGRQLFFQLLRQLACDLISTHADGLAHILQRVFRDQIIFALAEQQSD